MAAAKCSTAPTVQWNWVIEALANFEQVETSTLIGLVKMAPAISGDLGKDAREVVSMRILESLFVHGNEAIVDGDSSQTAKIRFDASERCEDVLQKILNETPEPMTKLETEKWDVRSFLMHKRSTLPKCMLKKLKEAILESSHPLLASLKERSRVIANVSENTSPGIDGNFNVQGTVKDDLAFSNPRKDKNKNQEKVMQEANKVERTAGATTENTGREECEMTVEPPLEDPNGKKLMEHDAHATDIAEKNSMEHEGRHETSSDSERADDENTDIAAKKEAFLNSQCSLDQDSMAMTEWSEMNLCMKCNEGGQLLVCSSDACPLRVHESCLGSAVTLDENGAFFCPFCAYSRAILKYVEAKRKASLARKDLQAFSSFTVDGRPNKSSKKQRETEIKEGRKMGAFGETTKGNDSGDTVSRANNVNCMSNKEDSTRVDPLMPVVNDDPSCGEKEAAVGSADNSLLPEPSTSCLNGVSVADRSMKETEEVRLNVDEGCESTTRIKEHQQTTELPQNPIPQPSTPKQKSKEKESHRSGESSCSRRLRKRKVHPTSPSVPSSRRKTLPWTKLEEETLKEGVQRYSDVNNKGIPWKEILDFGRSVFLKGRTPIDLKDKWRNVCKGSPNLK